MLPSTRLVDSSASRSFLRYSSYSKRCITNSLRSSWPNSRYIHQANRAAAPIQQLHSPNNHTPRIGHPQPQQCRTFSHSLILSKKKGSKEKDSSPASSKDSSPTAGDDPFDFSQLSNSIKEAVERLKEDVSKLRAGGRLNPEVIEGLRVTVSKANGGKGASSKDTVKLGEIAQVIPKTGRSVMILASEENFVKPITAAITSSNLSLNPQPDSHNSLQLNVPIPPPTKESREQSVKDAKAAMDKASNAVKNGRATLNKKLKGMKKTIRPDDLRKALEQMEKVTEKGQKEVKDAFEAARKALES